jgi:hypothetical protein
LGKLVSEIVLGRVSPVDILSRMGYHVIVNSTAEGVVSRYVETPDELAQFSDLTPDAIVYQGEPHWVPVPLGAHPQCSNYLHDWFRAGVKAQTLFRKLAHEHGLILENLSQDQASFRSYTANVDKAVKRGDCLIRNARNLEVEIKCQTIYPRGDEEVFWFDEADIEKHLNMQEFTGCPIVMAVFERAGDAPVDGSLRMILVDEIKRLLGTGAVTVDEKAKNGKAYVVALESMRLGFEIIDEIRGVTNRRRHPRRAE